MTRPATADRDRLGASQHVRDAVALAAAAPRAGQAAERLAPLFADIDWLAELTERALAPMRADPSATPALSTVRNGPVLTATLAATLSVRLMLTLIEGAAERADMEPGAGRGSIAFSGGHGLYRLLGDKPADALIGEAEPDATHCRLCPVQLQPGQWLSLDERREAVRIAPQAGPILLLRAQIGRTPAPPMRRYAIATGALIGTVQADQGFARSAMLLSLLRAAQAAEAVPAMIALLDAPAGRARWTVMRELLALDAGAAWPHLQAMAAGDPDPAVAAAARSILDRAAPCPA